jgi:hypothetical protein
MTYFMYGLIRPSITFDAQISMTVFINCKQKQHYTKGKKYDFIICRLVKTD